MCSIQFVAQEKPFPVRSVPDTLAKAAEESLKALSAASASEKDVMQAPILVQGIPGKQFTCRHFFVCLHG